MIGSAEPRNVAAPKYFRKTPQEPGNSGMVIGIIGIVALFIAILSSTSTDESAVCLAPLCGGVGLMAALFGFFKHWAGRSSYKNQYALAEPKPSDEQMDQWLKGDIEQIKSQALVRLDLQQDEIITDQKDSLIIIGPGEAPGVQIGADRVMRFSVYDILLIYLTDHQLSTYKCTLTMANGVPLNVTTQEYHYTDIVSVSTQTVSGKEYFVTVNGEKKSIDSYQEFALSVASGEQIKITVSLPQLEQVVVGGQLAETNAEQAIRIIRAVLREKKSGEHR